MFNKLSACTVTETIRHMWLDLLKPVQIAQELKSILLPNIKAIHSSTAQTYQAHG